MSLSQYVADKVQKPVKMPLGEWIVKHELPVIAEHKIDGRRVFLFCSNNKLVMASRHNGTYTKQMYPELFGRLETLTKLSSQFILDGEFVPPSKLVLFDVLQLDGENLTTSPLITRKQYLSWLAPEFAISYKIMRTQADFQSLWDEYIQAGYEGIVLKDQSSKYYETNCWWKKKKNDTLDVVILREEEGKEHTWYVGVYGYKGGIVELGKVGTFTKKVNPNDIKLGSVVEVEFQEITKEKKLRNAFIIKTRTDKIASECLEEQL